ncbi:MAG: hypothetical protein ACXACR_13400 [Candidatus Hodarchaeales archaeon]|jgi:hypothetical protein
MSDDDFHRFLKRWSKNFFNQDDTPQYSNLDRRDDYGDWSKRFLDHYDKTERGTGEDGTIDLIKKVTSDFLSYIDEVEEESKKSKKKR